MPGQMLDLVDPNRLDPCELPICNSPVINPLNRSIHAISTRQKGSSRFLSTHSFTLRGQE